MTTRKHRIYKKKNSRIRSKRKRGGYKVDGHEIPVRNKSEDNNKILLDAVTNDKFEFVEALLKPPADVNAKDKDGNTALMIATLIENSEMVKLLLANYADVNVRNKDGKTALELAYKNNENDENDVIIKLLLAKDNGSQT